MKRNAFEDLRQGISDRSTSVAILGLGYVGLPLSLAVVKAGYQVIGFDTDPERITELRSGKSPLITVNAVQLAESIKSRKLLPTGNVTDLGHAKIFVICVPTPLDRKREPDLSAVVEAGCTIAKVLKRGDLISLESSTYPGTTCEVLVPILESSGMKCGSDFEVAYSPEREDPGNKKFGTAVIPKVVGADTEVGRELACAFYASVVERIVPVSSTKAAEATKILENVYRAVNISLVNELKVIFDGMGIDIWETIEAAKTKPFGFNAFYPGPGMGGHCIPVDPFYLSSRARELGLPAKFIELAGSINHEMPRYVAGKLTEALKARGCSLRGSRVLLLGFAYKPDISDIRESPSISLFKLLRRAGATVHYFDPHVPCPPKGLRIPATCSVSPDASSMAQYDAAVLVTAHSAFDYKMLYDNLRLIVDTRNAFAHIGDPEGKIVKA